MNNCNKAELVAIYGRRRIGKTYLVDETLKDALHLDIQDLAELIKELYYQIKESSMEKVTLIGHSWETWLVLLFAEKHSKFTKEEFIVF